MNALNVKKGYCSSTSVCACRFQRGRLHVVVWYFDGYMFSYLGPNANADDDDDDGLESVASSTTAGSEEEGSNHHLLTAPNGEVAFLMEKPVRLAKELL